MYCLIAFTFWQWDFVGTAVAMPASKQAIDGMEDSNAKETLLAEPKAAGAYDKIPFKSASAIFTMDTSNDIFLLHSIQASLCLHLKCVLCILMTWDVVFLYYIYLF